MARSFKHPTAPVGDKLAPKIAHLVRHVMNEHLRETGGVRSKIAVQAALDFFKTITDERDEHAAELLGLWLGGEKTHPGAEKLLQFIAGGEGEMSALLSSGVLSSAVGSSIGSGLANILAPLNQAIMLADPAQILPPGQMAALAATRIVDPGYAAHISAMSGIPGVASAYLLEASYNWPSAEQGLELFRRRKIDQAALSHILRRNAIPEAYIEGLTELWERPLDPEELALMVLKGIKTEEEARSEATLSGVNTDRLDRMILATGEPPGLEQMMEAYRRKLVDGPRFEKAVRQSRVRNEWTDVLLALRFQPASPADAIRGAVQGHIDKAKAKTIAEEGSLRPEDFDWMYETAGNPPGTMQMIELWRRGKMTQKQVEQGIRESRYKNKYIGPITDLKRVIPPLYQITRILTAGGMTNAEGAKLLTELGYDKTVVTGLIHSATGGKVAKQKEVAVGILEELYYDHAIDEAEALKHLKALGYDDASAKLILSVVDLRREKTVRQAAMAPIKTEYVNRHLDRNEAQQRLDALGLPHKQVTFALDVWTVDREAHTKLLTEAQIVKANLLGLLDDANAEARLEALGYRHEDARLLLDMEKGRSTPAP